MKRFWTADMHLGHANVASYCARPWCKPWMMRDGKFGIGSRNWISEEAKNTCSSNMNNALIANFNSRVGRRDTTFHVGDFCCRGNERGVSGSKTRSEVWEEMLHGKIVHIMGNHDANNGTRYGIETAVVALGNYKAFVQHRPIERRCEVPDFCDFVICGHVHELWRIKRVEGMILINVGVDANKFYPLTDSEVIGIYEKENRNPIDSRQ